MGKIGANARVDAVPGPYRVFVAIGWAVGTVFLGDWVAGAIFFLIIAGLLNFISYFFSSKLVLMSYRAKVVTEAEAPRSTRSYGRSPRPLVCPCLRLP